MNQQPKVTTLTPTYKKTDQDIWVLNVEDIPVDKSLIKDQQIVSLGPKTIAGNHSHSRVEWFVGIGELFFVYLDENNHKHEIPMHPDGQLTLIEVPSLLPHAVENRSETKPAVIFEYANGKMTDRKSVKVI